MWSGITLKFFSLPIRNGMSVTNLADLLDILSKKYSWKNVTDSSTPLVWDVVGIGSLSSMAKFQLRLAA